MIVYIPSRKEPRCWRLRINGTVAEAHEGLRGPSGFRPTGRRHSITVRVAATEYLQNYRAITRLKEIINNEPAT